MDACSFRYHDSCLDYAACAWCYDTGTCFVYTCRDNICANVTRAYGTPSYCPDYPQDLAMGLGLMMLASMSITILVPYAMMSLTKNYDKEKRARRVGIYVLCLTTSLLFSLVLTVLTYAIMQIEAPGLNSDTFPISFGYWLIPSTLAAGIDFLIAVYVCLRAAHIDYIEDQMESEEQEVPMQELATVEGEAQAV